MSSQTHHIYATTFFELNTPAVHMWSLIALELERSHEEGAGPEWSSEEPAERPERIHFASSNVAQRHNPFGLYQKP